MSQAALALLSSDDGASETPEESPSKRAIALLEGRATVPETPKRSPSVLMSPVGGAEMLLRRATGITASIPAAVAYGGAAVGRAIGLDVDPRSAMAKTQEYFTYDPVTESGQAGEELLNRGVSTVMAPVAKLADRAATKVGEVSPIAETALREAPAAATAAGGLMGLSPFASPAMSLVRSAPGTVASGAKAVASGAAAAGRKIAETGERVSDATVRAVGGTVRERAEVTPDINPLAQQSMGAASAVPSQLKTASPELQRAIREAAQKTGGSVPPEVMARHLEADSLPIPIRYTEGQATRDPVKFSNEVNDRAKHPEYAAHFNDQKQKLVDNLDEIRREAAPGVVGNDTVQNGQALIDKNKMLHEARQQEIGEAYAAARAANGEDLPMDGVAFVKRADAALKRDMKARYLPADIEADMNEFRSGERQMTLTDFENLRTNMAAAARKAQRSGDGNAARAISVAREALEATEPVGVAADVKPLFDKARALAKADFDLQRRDPAYKAAIDDETPIGEASPLADSFVDKYIVRGSRAHVQRMRETHAGDPEVQELMAAAGLNYLKSKSGIDMFTNEGTFSQAGYNRALAQLRPKMEDLVGERAAEQAQALGNVAYNIMVAPEGAFVNRSNSTVVALKEGAKSAIEGAANVAAHGIPIGTWTRRGLENRAEKKAVRESLKVGAGLTNLRDVPKQPN